MSWSFSGIPAGRCVRIYHNKAKDCKMVGYWKVYGDEEKAKKIFDKYRKCSQVYLDRFERGYTLEKLTVARKTHKLIQIYKAKMPPLSQFLNSH